MDISGHFDILRAAFAAPPLISRRSLRIIMLANAAVDARQTAPWLHFDNAPDRHTIVQHWRAGVARQIARVVDWCRLRPDGRIRSRLRALWCYGQLTHTLQDFYAHTNWVELHPSPSERTTTAPLLASTLAVEQLPAELGSGYFAVRFFTPRHRWSGCPVVAGRFAPPAPYRYCHAQLAKDHPARGAGNQHTPDGARLYDIAAELATRTTRDSLAYIRHHLAADGRDATPSAFGQVFGLVT